MSYPIRLFSSLEKSKSFNFCCFDKLIRRTKIEQSELFNERNEIFDAAITKAPRKHFLEASFNVFLCESCSKNHTTELDDAKYVILDKNLSKRWRPSDNSEIPKKLSEEQFVREEGVFQISINRLMEEKPRRFEYTDSTKTKHIGYFKLFVEHDSFLCNFYHFQTVAVAQINSNPNWVIVRGPFEKNKPLNRSLTHQIRTLFKDIVENPYPLATAV